jgi:hypothetical protein
VFILYSVAIGLLLGVVLGGRLTGLAALRFRWAPAIALGLIAQLALFSEPVTARIGDLGPAVYVGTTSLVVLAVIRNRTIPGMPIVAAGAASNLLAIVANGGYMPAGRSALEALGKVEPTVYSNSALMPDPVLWPLTDVFAMPRWIPGANIFSVGDVLIALGVASVIVIAMRAGSGAPAAGPRSVRLRTGPEA